MEVLQTSALPLGYAAVPVTRFVQWREFYRGARKAVNPAGETTRAGPRGEPALMLERETGVEPATSTLARLHSTTELFPLAPGCARRAEILPGDSGDCQGERAGRRLRRTRRRRE